MINLSARARIVLLVIASALPILGLTVYVGVAQRAAVEASERQELRLIAELTAKHPEQLIASARQLLFAIAGHTDHLLSDRKTCDAYFRRLAPDVGGLYRAMGVILPNGEVFCNSATPDNSRPINVSDRLYFRLAVESRQFAVGEYQVGRATKRPSINVAYPVLGTDRRVQAIVFAALNLDMFAAQGESQLAQSHQGMGRVVTFFDRHGVVLAQYPDAGDRVGEKNRDLQLTAQMSKINSGVFSALDLNGVHRLYAVESVNIGKDGIAPLRVLVSTSQDMMFAASNRALTRIVAGIVVVTLVLLVIAWFGAEVLVMRRFRALLDMTDKVRAGDLSVRSGFGGGREELTRLGNALDSMVQELQARDQQLKQVLEQLNEQAFTDQLTGLPNRHYLWNALEAELMRTRRKKAPLAVMLLDVDHFKQINDRWGHGAGDLTLKNVTYAIRAVVRGSDVVARYGGEEFVIVLPEASEEIARSRAEALRTEIAGLQLTYDGQPLGAITASVGIAVSKELHQTAEGMVNIADQAMYEAKQGGRNRVVLKNADTPDRAGSLQ